MRAVVDTNVLVSAILNQNGPPGRVLSAWQDRKFELLISDELFAELEGVVNRPHIIRRIQKPSSTITALLNMIRSRARAVHPRQRLGVITADPSDNRVLEAALAGEADYIVTGDQHLLELDEFQGVEIVTPARFVAVLAEQAM